MPGIPQRYATVQARCDERGVAGLCLSGHDSGDWFSDSLNDRWLSELLDYRGLPLMSVGVLLVICCRMRFQAIAIGALDVRLGRIPESLEQASRLLGENGKGTFVRVHFPVLLW